MLREERLQYILNKLNTNHRVSCSALSVELDVSDDTIRRDLNELASLGFLKKVHGGAIPHAPSPRDYNERLTFAQEGKLKLAQKALPFFAPDMVIIFDGGTTNLQVAKLLPQDYQATVYTNSFPIVNELISRDRIELFFLGGQVYNHAQVAVGQEAIKALKFVRADLCLLGSRSIHDEAGITIPFREEARLKRKMVACSQKVILLATEEKLDTASHHVICGIRDIDTLILEDDISPEVLDRYRAKGVQVL